MNNVALVKKLALIAILLLVLVSCGPVSTLPVPVLSPVPATVVPTNTPALATDIPIAYPTSGPALASLTDIPATPTPSQGFLDIWCDFGKICVRWFIGMGIGTNPAQVTVEQAVANDFNASQDKIYLMLEVVPFNSARDTILTEIAAGNAPDIIGPVSWARSNVLHGQWKNLKAQIAEIPEVTKDFNPALLDSYNTPEGQITLPFAVYPSAIFYNTALFDKAGLASPPSTYGPNLGPATYELDGRNVEWNWDTVREVARRLTIDGNGKNATESGFDKNKIVQYGFTWNYETQPSYVGTFWGNGSYTAADRRTAQLPDVWKDSWNWTYDGIWGEQPFIPNGQISASADFDNGNVFNSGKVAMTDQPSWVLCCMANVQTWDIGVLPAYKGQVAGRVDADFFGISKDTRHPDEAFQVLTYLTTTGVQKLIIGSKDMPAAYGNAMPARAQDQGPWLEAKKAQFPWVKHWNVLTTNLAFPDSPSAETYMPNYTEAWARGESFYNLLANTGGLDLEKEEATFLSDLQVIFDKK